MKKLLLAVLFALALPTLAVAIVSDTDTDTQTTPGSCIELKNNMRYRMNDATTGNEVSELQNFLITKGFLNSEATGYFGAMTFNAVKAYQSSLGWTPTGYVGAMTRGEVKKATCGGGVTTQNINTNNTSTGDLCAQQGLNNIDETNWENMRASHVGMIYSPYKDNPINYALSLGHKMSAGESYSFPINPPVRSDTSSYSFSINHNPYFSTPYPAVIHISDKKCDFTPSLRFGKNYFTMSHGSDHSINISVHSTKYEDPNYDFNTISYREAPIRLTAGKKYYMNVRWLRKSDVADSNENLKDTLFGRKLNYWFTNQTYLFFGVQDVSVLTKSAIKSVLDNKFNRKGDACIDANYCFISWRTFGDGTGPMAFVTKSQYDRYATILATDLKNSQEYQRLMIAESARKAAMTPPDTSPISDEVKARLRTQAYGGASAVCEIGSCGSTSTATANTVVKYTPPSGQKPTVSGPTSVKTGTQQTHYIYFMGPRTKFCVTTSTSCVPDAQLGTGESSGWTMAGGDGSPYNPTWKRIKVLGVGVPPGTVFNWFFTDPDTNLNTSFAITITQ